MTAVAGHDLRARRHGPWSPRSSPADATIRPSASWIGQLDTAAGRLRYGPTIARSRSSRPIEIHRAVRGRPQNAAIAVARSGWTRTGGPGRCARGRVDAGCGPASWTSRLGRPPDASRPSEWSAPQPDSGSRGGSPRMIRTIEDRATRPELARKVSSVRSSRRWRLPAVVEAAGPSRRAPRSWTNRVHRRAPGPSPGRSPGPFRPTCVSAIEPPSSARPRSQGPGHGQYVAATGARSIAEDHRLPRG